MPSTVRIGTRASTLALTQTGHVGDALTALAPLDVELVHVRTDGDRLKGSLATLGGTGVFVTALRDALLDGRCDLAVHSFKDLPTGQAPGLVIGAVPPRQDPRDALCARNGWTLQSLPEGARVGTGSPRRAAQLLATRPDLEVVDIRGNVDTRLGRVAEDDLDAVVLAYAGLARLGRLEAVTQVLDPAIMLPAPGQGALAVERRTLPSERRVPAEPGVAADPAPTSASTGAHDDDLLTALDALDHRPTRLAVIAERALLARLEAGCAAPVGALARWGAGDVLTLDSIVIRTDGTERLRRSASASIPLDPPAPRRSDDALAPAEQAAAALGTRVAEDLLAAGAADLAPVGPR